MHFSRKTFILILSVLIAVFFSSMLFAQGKLRVAVVDFENKSTWHWWGDRLGEAAADVFVTDLLNTGKFTMIEREKIDAILAEQQLGASGAVTSQTAAKIGKLLGVDLILTGSITQFSVDTTKAGFRGIGGSITKGKVVLQARLVNTSTGEIVVAAEEKNDKKLIGAYGKGANFQQNYNYGLANEVMHPAVEKMVAKIVDKTAGMTPAAPEGRVIKVEGSKVWINLGAGAANVGDVFIVMRKGEELIDPDTGLSLGSEEEQVGKIIVTEVQAKFSIGSVQSGNVKAKDYLKKP
jgi:curli biogenesis system outer membrane secretion channel CsgG